MLIITDGDDDDDNETITTTTATITEHLIPGMEHGALR